MIKLGYYRALKTIKAAALPEYPNGSRDIQHLPERNVHRCGGHVDEEDKLNNDSLSDLGRHAEKNKLNDKTSSSLGQRRSLTFFFIDIFGIIFLRSYRLVSSGIRWYSVVFFSNAI